MAPMHMPRAGAAFPSSFHLCSDLVDVALASKFGNTRTFGRKFGEKSASPFLIIRTEDEFVLSNGYGQIRTG